ncbi:hypothetical protein BU15DRAFT_68318 [Melanogaster broomeanus]|nr:hypothetical protein BU15DRAFT_68318 [Melanogaster broomeanus]
MAMKVVYGLSQGVKSSRTQRQHCQYLNAPPKSARLQILQSASKMQRCSGYERRMLEKPRSSRCATMPIDDCGAAVLVFTVEVQAKLSKVDHILLKVLGGLAFGGGIVAGQQRKHHLSGMERHWHSKHCSSGINVDTTESVSTQLAESTAPSTAKVPTIPKETLSIQPQASAIVTPSDNTSDESSSLKSKMWQFKGKGAKAGGTGTHLQFEAYYRSLLKVLWDSYDKEANELGEGTWGKMAFEKPLH